MNVKFTPEALYRPPCPVHQHQHTHRNHFHWICMDPYQTSLISLLHGAISLDSLMLNSLNQQAPKMYHQSLLPYTPTMATQKSTRRTMGRLSIAKSSETFSLQDGITLSTPTLTILKRMKLNASWNLSKSSQNVHRYNSPLQQAIDDLLSDYRSTPHPAIGVAPGNMLFHGGYNSIFPQTPGANKQVIEEAKVPDTKRKQDANERMNMSRWRKYPNIIQSKSWHCG